MGLGEGHNKCPENSLIFIAQGESGHIASTRYA
jgi:hypothetical protein